MKELFVSGRLCLFGEHSDWVGGHRRQNINLPKGYVIVAPTNQGNYAAVSKLEEPVFEFSSELGKLRTSLDEGNLLKIAREGGIFSYVAGVAQEIVSSYKLEKGKGISIRNYKTDLPLKKGLSSSASVCVLTAKAFDEVFDLGFTQKRIMELAYLGEIKTPSRCGKMDQACAYNKPVLMTFDGDFLETNELEIGRDAPLLIVDLKKGKDTIKILAGLNEGFPWANNNAEREKQNYFKTNEEIVSRARISLKEGDIEELGRLMTYAQTDFDKYLISSCPSELSAPILHYVLSMKEIQPLVYGGKGVGSGGDGTAQFVCKTTEDREKAKIILNEKGFECLDLDLKKNI